MSLPSGGSVSEVLNGADEKQKVVGIEAAPI
jgi:hypothetical protein